MGEFEYIKWVKNRAKVGASTSIGIGDDAAAYRFTTGRDVLVTTDMLLEGSCFILAEAGPFAVGRKSLAVNLSDIAAMAGVPRAAVVSLALPRKDGTAIARGLFDGISSMAAEFDVEIIGGDTNSWDGPLAISITLLGEASDKPPVRRNGAKVGDWIFVTGPLGGSLLGKHLTFTPRVREALELHRSVNIHAMIDLSDGLSRDLGHICEESHCGAVVHADWLPIADAAIERERRDGTTRIDHALHDGEDFELCFTVSPEDGQMISSTTHYTRIGFIEPAVTYQLRFGEDVKPLDRRGYEHAFE